MIDWRNKTTNPQQVGVAVAKGRRSNFDGVWPPGPKPAGKPASKPCRYQHLRMPCGNDQMRMGLRHIGDRMSHSRRGSLKCLKLFWQLTVGRISRLIGGKA